MKGDIGEVFTIIVVALCCSSVAFVAGMLTRADVDDAVIGDLRHELVIAERRLEESQERAGSLREEVARLTEQQRDALRIVDESGTDIRDTLEHNARLGDLLDVAIRIVDDLSRVRDVLGGDDE